MAIRRASGSLFGLALGDALGAPTEFMGYTTIISRYTVAGPCEPEGNPARVTDDTQMMLAVGQALLTADRPLSAATLEESLRDTFVEWMDSPDNNRAPGMTCMRACAGLERGLPWYEASVILSKGCGANMRVAPVGLLPPDEKGITASKRSAIAQFQAAVTHGHPTALAASDLTATAIADLAAGGDPAGLPHRLREYAQAQRSVYHADWLGSLWEFAHDATPQAYIERGWDECLIILDRLDTALAHLDQQSDPCLATGAGWIAEEAFATGLLCFLMYPEDGVAAIRRAAVTSGDSDSIACLAGAFAGAHLGLNAWPSAWLERIEYAERLEALGLAWDR